MRITSMLSVCGMVGLFASGASPADISGQWNARFETQIGVQTYVFSFQAEAGVITGMAESTSGQSRREAELSEIKLEGDSLSFIELLDFRGDQLRIRYEGKIGDDGIAFTRQVGNFATEEFKAVRGAPPEVTESEATPPRGEPQRGGGFDRPIVLGADDVAAFPDPPPGFRTRRKDIPHGKLEMIEYDSKTVGVARKMNVYTPPGYSADVKYPVLYLLHGIGGDEAEWQRYATPDVLLDNLIADGKAVPMIVVMPNGRAQKNDRPEGNVFASAPSFAVFEADLLDDAIPAIDARYSTLADREHRALAGLSMGGGQSLNFGLGKLGPFAWVGGFSSAPNTRPPAQLVPNPEETKAKLKLLWLSCGNKDGLISISQSLHRYLKEHGVPHVWHVDGNGHDPTHWSHSLWWFVQHVFKATGPGARAANPIIYADVPDMAMVRVGGTYYMSSTTMHMSPGLPIMKSTDLVNWELVSYAYDVLGDTDKLNQTNGQSAYGAGSWASSLRYHNGTFYATTFSETTGKTHVYTTQDIDGGPWQAVSFRPSLHDHSLFFDDDGRVYMLYGGGDLRLVELNSDLSGIKQDGFNEVVIQNATRVAGGRPGLPAEGSQILKVSGKYYVFNITWPRGGMRTVLVHRADKITGPYEGRVALRDRGIAQGSLIDTPEGDWFAYLFRDYGAVGRIPYLVPVTWEHGWPVLGVDDTVPDTMDLPPSRGLIPGIVASDEFERKPGGLALVWQWNHNPDNTLWSLTQRPGYLRLTTGRVDDGLLSARNMLTQRTFGPVCSGTTVVDTSQMKDGDAAGLALLQRDFGLVGVRVEGSARFAVMEKAQNAASGEVQRVRLTQSTVFLKAACDFRNRADEARFSYSLDGESWTPIGDKLQMRYTLPHFMGYRFGLFNYATKTPGGHADFDCFRVADRIDF